MAMAMAMAMANSEGSPIASEEDVEEEAVKSIDRETSSIRNICIVAHVDHGKTTLADHLIASGGGGVLHPKQAGRLRYLDYRDDEQLRAITMKSSSIALTFQDRYTINLIDSPGHVDFCSEVSTAARLSDGALVLVDVCEGIHIQTHAVLRQVWIEKVVPCLVLNKLDRLIVELRMSPTEAYARLQSILMEVNNIISTFRSEKYLSDVDSVLASTNPSEHSDGSGNKRDEETLTDLDDEEDAFSPQRGNVVFACALDGWGFRVNQFASLYAAKLGASENILQKALWGDFYYIPKTKKIVGKKASGGKVKPMFVQFILEPLWQVYEAGLLGMTGRDTLNKIIKSMSLNIPARDLQNKDAKVVLQAVMSRWLPLADTIFAMVVELLPNPVSAQSERIIRLFPDNNELLCKDEVKSSLEKVRSAVKTCDDTAKSPCIVFVSKMFAVPIDFLPKRGPNGELLPDLKEELNNLGDVGHGECFLAFARVFSGVLHAGQKILVLYPFHDPTKEELEKKHMQEAVVQGLYMMMGRGLEPKASVSAGNLVAIRGLGQYILKTATLSTTPFCWPFRSMTFQAAPIMRVALEPSDPAELGALTRGLRLLNRADPFVEVSLSTTGEHVLAAAGEVHLERCIKDLRERFAKIELVVSPPLVAFKETIEIEKPGSLEASKSELSSDIVERTTANGRCTVRVHVCKLPLALTKALEQNEEILRKIMQDLNGKEMVHGKPEQVDVQDQDPVIVLRNSLITAVQVDDDSLGHERRRNEADAKTWLAKLERVWSLGPRHVGPNLLLTPLSGNAKRLHEIADRTEGLSMSPECALIGGAAYVSEILGITKHSDTLSDVSIDDASSPMLVETHALESSVVSGFQLATASGPLCEEPTWGLAFTVEAVVSSRGKVGVELNDTTENAVIDQYGPFSGQVMTAVKEACRAAMLAKRPRLVEAMYFCEISTPTEFLGQMYGVLGKRRARVLKEEMREGTDMFTVHAYMPVAESFGFTDELRRKTSGAASPQLVLSHWEELSQDPFFVPRTEEEREEFGDGASVPPNTARKLIDSVRRRKGLPVEDKVVQHATKQRTLARKV